MSITRKKEEISKSTLTYNAIREYLESVDAVAASRYGVIDMDYKHSHICTNCGNGVGLNRDSSIALVCPFCRQETLLPADKLKSKTTTLLHIVPEKKKRGRPVGSVSKKRTYLKRTDIDALIPRIPEIFKMQSEKKGREAICAAMNCSPSTTDRILNKTWRSNERNPKRRDRIATMYAIVEKTYPHLIPNNLNEHPKIRKEPAADEKMAHERRLRDASGDHAQLPSSS